MNCNKICSNLVISTAVAVVGTSLVISIPQDTYDNCERVCLLIAQDIPDAATINMPVSVAIGADTTTLYPLIRCSGLQVTASEISSNSIYPSQVITNATSGSFKVLAGLPCNKSNVVPSIPVV